MQKERIGTAKSSQNLTHFALVLCPLLCPYRGGSPLLFCSRGGRMQALEKSSPFQQLLFTLNLKESFEYIELYFFTCMMRCIFSKIKTSGWSVLLHFLVSKI